MEPQTQPPAQPSATPVLQKRLIFAILIGVIVLLVIGTIVWFFARSSDDGGQTDLQATTVPTGAAPAQPLVTSVVDTDHDTLSDDDERQLGTKPDVADTDGDGLSDGVEAILTKTDPKNPKSKDPALTDYEWVRRLSQ